MFKFGMFICTTLLIFSASQSLASGSDARSCALTRVYECAPDSGCKEWPNQEMALPGFVRIDLTAKTITSLDNNVKRGSTISLIERIGGLAIMHGTEGQRSWSGTFNEATGSLTISASGDRESFVIFGSCLTP